MKIELIGGWTTGDYGNEAVKQTSGHLLVEVGERIATRVADQRSRSVRNEIRVSLYPLALWLAASWWRLRWESSPSSSTYLTSDLYHSWRMAHEINAAGYGYVWPKLTFATDGEIISVSSRVTNLNNFTENIQFLDTTHEGVLASDFEHLVDRFMDLVLSRLRDTNVFERNLSELWSNVLDERSDPELYRYRKLEAELGYDPDEIDSDVVDEFVRIMSDYGSNAIDEVAPVCAGENPLDCLQRINNVAQTASVTASPNVSSLIEQAGLIKKSSIEPWKRGKNLAAYVRSEIGPSSDAVHSSHLAEILGMRTNDLSATNILSDYSIIGLGIRSDQTGSYELHFHKKRAEARRFEAARFIADCLLVDDKDNWLPVTDTKTARQKTQRAFATEYLCPQQLVLEYLKGNASDDNIEDAAEHFGVSAFVVRNQINDYIYMGNS